WDQPVRQDSFFSGRVGPDWPGARRRYLVLGRLYTPDAGVQRSSSCNTAIRSARERTLRARARLPPFFRLLSSDIDSSRTMEFRPNLNGHPMLLRARLGRKRTAVRW